MGRHSLHYQDLYQEAERKHLREYCYENQRQQEGNWRKNDVRNWCCEERGKWDQDEYGNHHGYSQRHLRQAIEKGSRSVKLHFHTMIN